MDDELSETPKEELDLDDELKNIEEEIEDAIDQLDEQDLASELDDVSLVDIDSLSSNDIKLALGEEVEAAAEPSDDIEDEIGKEEDIPSTQVSATSTDGGVEALKNLLKALTNEQVAASLKGMNISINITMGDK